jgi:AAA domain
MRDAEIFAYEVCGFHIVDGAEVLLVRETSRLRTTLPFAKMTDSMIDFLDREREEKRDGDLVYIGAEESLELGRQVPRPEFWNVIDTDKGSGIVRLRRPRLADNVLPEPKGFLRAFGLFGQMSLIRRRKRAIERLGNHAYLLRALERPDFVFLDSGEGPLPRRVDPEKIDDAKRSALGSIWRTRPIFALQGPPGTGKTTLVANLLSQIFEDDSVAQVLVTAQAHAAVDVLREQVSKEFEGNANFPLAIRLPRTKGDETPDRDYVEQVTRRMLDRAISEMVGQSTRSKIQDRWLEMAKEAVHALDRHDTKGHARDLCELVRRSAGITYCTTTAGNLAELAVSTQTFDWSIIEEAGKAHGFDLVLPLQTGHRWLLIGDQKQLSPYRIDNFRSALLKLDATFDAIRALPERAGNLLDIDLVLRWQKGDEAERALWKDVWLSWLNFFATLHRMCSTVNRTSAIEGDRKPGAPVLAEMLSQQHRMHPVIADLVSNAYYRKSIESKTIDKHGNPLARVVHPFVAPVGIAGCAIVWLDTLWTRDNDTEEARSEESGGSYTSPEEVNAIERFLASLRTESDEKMRVAVLSPYRRQVSELNRRLKDWNPPSWVDRRGTGYSEKKRALAATVDSFQGDQADIVIVSLVRNNGKDPGKGLGFLREEKRMNVLFSRAERLLVLVGCWEFFKYQLQGVPHDDTQPLGHWRIAMDYLESCFDSGLAVRLAVSSFEEPK